MNLDDYVSLVRATLKTKYESIILGALTTALPVPFLLPIYKKLAGYIAAKIAEDNEMRAFFIYTDFRVSKQGREFLDALKQNKEIILNPPDEQSKIAAENIIIARFRELVKFSN
jgi:hypothetical protein